MQLRSLHEFSFTSFMHSRFSHAAKRLGREFRDVQGRRASVPIAESGRNEPVHQNPASARAAQVIEFAEHVWWSCLYTPWRRAATAILKSFSPKQDPMSLGGLRARDQPDDQHLTLELKNERIS